MKIHILISISILLLVSCTEDNFKAENLIRSALSDTSIPDEMIKFQTISNQWTDTPHTIFAIVQKSYNESQISVIRNQFKSRFQLPKENFVSPHLLNSTYVEYDFNYMPDWFQVDKKLSDINAFYKVDSLALVPEWVYNIAQIKIQFYEDRCLIILDSNMGSTDPRFKDSY